MIAFILKRLALVVPTFLGITLLVFALIRLVPGDPVEALSGERGMTEERYQRLVHEFGLDRPLPVQYADYVWKALHGDLGLSAITHEPVFSSSWPAFRRRSSCRWWRWASRCCSGCPPASSPRSSATRSGTIR
jgi:ABC-type dipeptide/oligopeptide/nickel transport system permease component